MFSDGSARRLAVFTRQWVAFHRAGLSVTDSLEALAADGRGPLAGALLGVVGELRAGARLSHALSRHPHVFPPMYIHMIEAAEESGRLDIALAQLSNYLLRDAAAGRRLRAALIYPCAVLTVAAGAVTVILTIVVPSFVSMFRDLHAELPPLTRALVGLGEYIGDHRLPLVSALTFGVTGGVGLARLPRGRRVAARLALRLPALGSLIRLAAVERFAGTLGAGLAAGVPVVRAFDVAAPATGNREMASALARVRVALVQGEGLAGALRETGVFPAVAVRMIEVGERTGDLAEQLSHLADYYADDIAHRTARLTALLEPAMVLGVGIVVGVVALAVVTPMYGLLRSFR